MVIMASRIFVCSLMFMCSVAFVEAHVPNIVGTISQNEIRTIEDPILSQAFYGVLEDSPHTFKIQRDESFTLSLQVLLPDIETSKNNVSAIVVKLPKERGRVEEIARLKAGDASWDTFYEPFGGDTYRRGPTFEQELDAGSYIVEVHTPENRDKYVLVVGKKEEMSIGYFETVRRLIEVKNFFDKSPLRVVESPFVYAPLILVVGGIGFVYWYRRRRRRG